MARVPLQTRAELPDEYQYLLSDEAMGEIHLLCAMANNPDILQSYMRYGSTLWSECGLKAADLERCILAVARELDAAYEWHQHVPIAREHGVQDSELRAIANQRYNRFGDARTALLRYIRATVRGAVDGECFEAVSAHYNDETIVGVTLLATHYLATARFLNALAVPIEEPFIGWEPGDGG